jgi:outer membrane protein TolC
VFTTAWLAGCATTKAGPTRSDWATTYGAQDRTNDTPASSPAAPSTFESLEELLRTAELNNPGLRAAFDRWTAALEQVPQANSLPDPKISYAYFVESVETRVGPQRQKLGVSQTIPLFGKLGLRGDIALNVANATGAHFEEARLKLRFRVSSLWHDYYYLGRAIAVTEENLQLMTYLESVALAQYTSGKTPHASVIRAQVELGKLEDRLRTLRDQQRPMRASLNAALNRPSDTAVAWPGTVQYKPVTHTQQDLNASLLADNPQLAALRFMVEKERAATTLAGRSPIPDLTLAAEYIDTDESSFPNVLDSGKDAAIAKATINIPLWFGGYRAEKSQAEARKGAAERELLEHQNQLIAELERVHFELRDAERRVDLYEHTLLPKARQSVEVAEDAFTAGEVTFLDLVDAQRTLLEFELAHERAVADRATKHAHLKKLVGRDLTTDQKVEDGK